MWHRFVHQTPKQWMQRQAITDCRSATKVPQTPHRIDLILLPTNPRNLHCLECVFDIWNIYYRFNAFLMSISPNENACVLCEKDLVNLIAFSEERSCTFFCSRTTSFFFLREYFLFLKNMPLSWQRNMHYRNAIWAVIKT